MAQLRTHRPRHVLTNNRTRRGVADGLSRPRHHPPRRTHPTLLLALATVVTSAGCVNVPGPTAVICGTTLYSGQAIPVVQTLPAPTPGSAAQPPATASRLPHAMPSPEAVPLSRIDFLRTSTSCTTGAFVVFSPASHARLLTVARADDGNIAGLSFTVAGGPVTVDAWQHGKLTGTESFQPVPPFTHTP